eukprot:TRINITY_DN6582_c1_g1_i1.p1 TRINITY_DN6582_c1_g1~~TRINITY_DN6582_c1_g1_i1.p1  ORF type:complete len:208 (-),score=48.13 TRINITY_DN6582_c1_g1_i1:233-856(-)
MGKLKDKAAKVSGAYSYNPLTTIASSSSSSSASSNRSKLFASKQSAAKSTILDLEAADGDERKPMNTAFDSAYASSSPAVVGRAYGDDDQFEVGDDEKKSQAHTRASSSIVQQRVDMANQEQEQVLEDMLTVIKRLGVMSNQINDELKTQDEMLDRLGDNMDDANSRLQILDKKLQHLMRKSKCSYCKIIIVLAVIFFILFFIIIYF